MCEAKHKAFRAALDYGEHIDRLPDGYVVEDVLADAGKIERYFGGESFEAEAGKDYPAPATLAGLPSATGSVTLEPASAEMLRFPATEPVAAAPAEKAEEAKPERKKPGRKPGAAKKAKAPRKARATAVDKLDEAVVSVADKDAPIANGDGEHVEVPTAEPQSDRPMAA